MQEQEYGCRGKFLKYLFPLFLITCTESKKNQNSGNSLLRFSLSCIFNSTKVSLIFPPINYKGLPLVVIHGPFLSQRPGGRNFQKKYSRLLQATKTMTLSPSLNRIAPLLWGQCGQRIPGCKTSSSSSSRIKNTINCIVGGTT